MAADCFDFGVVAQIDFRDLLVVVARELLQVGEILHTLERCDFQPVAVDFRNGLVFGFRNLAIAVLIEIFDAVGLEHRIIHTRTHIGRVRQRWQIAAIAIIVFCTSRHDQGCGHDT